LGKILKFERPAKEKIFEVENIFGAIREQEKDTFFSVAKCMKSIILRCGFTEKNIRR